MEALDIHTHAGKRLQRLRNNKHGAGSLLVSLVNPLNPQAEKQQFVWRAQPT